MNWNAIVPFAVGAFIVVAGLSAVFAKPLGTIAESLYNLAYRAAELSDNLNRIRGHLDPTERISDDPFDYPGPESATTEVPTS